MKYLLLVAHGSRREASNDEVRRLAEKMQTQSQGFDKVGCAFLELATPLIPDGIRNAISEGATEVVVQPYFLSAGRHVVTDVPREVAVVQNEHPEITITIAPYLGMAEGISDLLLAQANSQIN